jgi:hypothetical protein
MELGSITQSPTRLRVSVQPNSYDCGYHVIFNLRSLADYVLEKEEGADCTLDNWTT